MKKIYIGNMNSDTTEVELNDLFMEYGEVGSIRVIRDRSGRPRGFAFVEMLSDAKAAAAIAALNGRIVDGRELKVNEAIPRERYELLERW